MFCNVTHNRNSPWYALMLHAETKFIHPREQEGGLESASCFCLNCYFSSGNKAVVSQCCSDVSLRTGFCLHSISRKKLISGLILGFDPKSLTLALLFCNFLAFALPFNAIVLALALNKTTAILLWCFDYASDSVFCDFTFYESWW